MRFANWLFIVLMALTCLISMFGKYESFMKKLSDDYVIPNYKLYC